MNTMILAPIVLCVLGIVFGAILAVAAKVFAVEKDPREEAIAECLLRRLRLPWLQRLCRCHRGR